MKQIITFLISVMLLMNYVNLAANDYTPARFENELCNFRFVLENPYGIGWDPDHGIEITVDGVDYGFVALTFGIGNYYAEEIIALPSGELQLFWVGHFTPQLNQFKVYNSLDELICSNPQSMPESLFFTYQNECIECLPLIDFEGVYNAEEHYVNLSWIAPESTDLIGFDIYRNDSLINQLSPSTISYSENTAELEDGNYTYCVVPVFPSICSLDDACFETYILNVGITTYKDNILIYPNPATHTVNITGADIVDVKVFNNIGQLILHQHSTNTINVSELQNGIYILSIETLTGTITQTKITINH